MGKFFSEYEVGQVFESPGRTVTESDIVQFAGLTWDTNPLHTDETFAAKTPFGGRVAHGMLSVAYSVGLGQLTGIFQGTTLALMNISAGFKAPVFPGDTIRLRLTVESTKPSSKGGKGVVVFAADVLNQKDEVAVGGQWTVMFRDKKPS